MTTERSRIIAIKHGSRESAALKASRLLTTGAVEIRLVHRGQVFAHVVGDSARYDVAHVNGKWRCTCAAYRANCSHVLAVRAVVAVERIDQ